MGVIPRQFTHSLSTGKAGPQGTFLAEIPGEHIVRVIRIGTIDGVSGCVALVVHHGRIVSRDTATTSISCGVTAMSTEALSTFGNEDRKTGR